MKKKTNPLVEPYGEWIDPYLNRDVNYERNCFIKAIYRSLDHFKKSHKITYKERIDYLCDVFFLSPQSIESIITNNYPIKKALRK